MEFDEMEIKVEEIRFGNETERIKIWADRGSALRFSPVKEIKGWNFNRTRLKIAE